MAYPPAYSRDYSFTDFETNHPGQPKPGPALDTEFDDVANALTATQTALALIQRADGALANGSVGEDQLDPTLFDHIADDAVADAEAAAAAAAASAGAAASSASAANGSATAAATSAATASGAAAQSGVSQGIAQDAANEAALSAAEADISADVAVQAANDTSGSVAQAQLHEETAFKWAEYLEGPVHPAPPGWPEAVDDGMFSSKWWAIRARDYNSVHTIDLGSGQADIGAAFDEWDLTNDLPTGLIYATWGVPPLTYVLTDPGNPSDPSSWTLISGGPGPAGPGNSLTIGTVTTGAVGQPADATITGVSPNQVLNLTLPTGATGAQGAIGPAGPPNALAVGTVTTGAPGSAAVVTITGTSPTQTINFTIPRGDTGAQGIQGIQGIQGPVGPPVNLADPTAFVTLVNQVGDSTAAMRSDAAPALSQAIVPTWTGIHTFGTGSAVVVSNDDPIISLVDTAQSLDNKRWLINANGTFDIYAVKDGAGSAFNPSLRFIRSGEALTAIQFGNAANNPTYNFLGTGAGSVNGSWTFTAPAGNRAIFVNGAANQFTASVRGSATAGQSFGLLLMSGTSAADVAINIRNQAADRDFLTILGNGSYTFGNATDNPTYTFAGTGVTTFNGTVSGQSANWNGVSTWGIAGRFTQISAPAVAITSRFDDNGTHVGFVSANGGITGLNQGWSWRNLFCQDATTFQDGGRISWMTEGDYSAAGTRNSSLRILLAVNGVDTEQLALRMNELTITPPARVLGGLLQCVGAPNSQINSLCSNGSFAQVACQISGVEGLYMISNFSGATQAGIPNQTNGLMCVSGYPLIFGSTGVEGMRVLPSGGLQVTGSIVNGFRSAAGLEIGIAAGNTAVLIAYNRGTSAYLPLQLNCTFVELSGPGSCALKIQSRYALQDVNDGWLRLNPAGEYGNGVYAPQTIQCGTYFRSDVGLATTTLSMTMRPNIGGLSGRGSFVVQGAVGGFHGLCVDDGGLRPVFMSNNVNCGIFVDADGKWITYRANSTTAQCDYNLTAPSFTSTSSRAIKRETGAPSKPASILARLRPLLYRLLDGDDHEQLGLIAEEVHEVCPQLSDGKAVAYDRLAILLLAAWQDEHATA